MPIILTATLDLQDPGTSAIVMILMIAFLVWANRRNEIRAWVSQYVTELHPRPMSDKAPMNTAPASQETSMIHPAITQTVIDALHEVPVAERLRRFDADSDAFLAEQLELPVEADRQEAVVVPRHSYEVLEAGGFVHTSVVAADEGLLYDEDVYVSAPRERQQETAPQDRPLLHIYDSVLRTMASDDDAIQEMLADYTAIPAESLPGAGWAAAHPPTSLDAALAYIDMDYMRIYGTPPAYAVPIGWYVAPDNRMRLTWTRLVDGVDHMLITGMKGTGKDTAAKWMALSLLQAHSPEDVQFYVIDGKGLDWAFLRDKAHCAMLCERRGDIPWAMNIIDEETSRRQQFLNQKGISKWRQGCGIPLAIILITELDLLFSEVGAGKVEQWLNGNMTVLRAYGGRAWVNTQNTNGLNTRWRGQIDLSFGGAQPDPVYDDPCLGLSTSAMLKAGECYRTSQADTVDLDTPKALPPSRLPAVDGSQGTMTVVRQGSRDVICVRTTWFDDEAIAKLAAALPSRIEYPQATYYPMASEQGIEDYEYGKKHRGARRAPDRPEEVVPSGATKTQHLLDTLPEPEVDETPVRDEELVQAQAQASHLIADYEMTTEHVLQRVAKLRALAPNMDEDTFVLRAASRLFRNTGVINLKRVRSALYRLSEEASSEQGIPPCLPQLPIDPGQIPE